MTDVLINGVRYVPVSNKPNAHHINKLTKILTDDCPFLSRNVRNDIIRKFKDEDIQIEKPEKPKTKKTKNPSKGRLYSPSNFKGFDEDGHATFKKGKYNRSEWTIHQAIEIRQWMNHGKLNKDKVKQLSEKMGLTENIIYKLMYNLKEGELDQWIELWLPTVNQVKSKTPIQNNPQKRKEMGWY